MKNYFIIAIILILILIYQFSNAQHRLSNERLERDPKWGCTIGAASGRATKDGRPMIWKTRDTDYRTNGLFFNTGNRYKFLAVIDAGNSQESWMSLNEKGFAILNSALYDLTEAPSGLYNGEFMTYAVANCASVADFKQLLDSTNITGRRTTACFAVMDSTGAAAIFETGGYSYWKYDAGDSIANPKGYILRTNFSIAGGGHEGLVRYQRTNALFNDFYAGDSITTKSILRYQMRDFADQNGIPFSIPFHGTVGSAPYGYIHAEETICNIWSAAGAVIQGILPGESALTSTFWLIIGCPATGIAIPYWVVGAAPFESWSTTRAPLITVANDIYTKIWGGSAWPGCLNSLLMRNDNGEGLLNDLFQAEDTIFARADTILAQWRQGQCDASAISRAESTYAVFALSALSATIDQIVEVESESNIAALSGYYLFQNYPNPFNPTTTIIYKLPETANVKLAVYNMLGQIVARLIDEQKPAGTYTVQFDGSGLTSGVYFCRLQAGTYSETKKIILIK